MQLYNNLSADERKILIDDAGKQRLTLSFYAYSQIENPINFRNELFLAWNKLDVLGRIYVAHEGINAQLSVPADCFYDFKNSIEVYDFMKNIRLNVAVEHDDFSFLKLTIKVRDKIVADGLNDPNFDASNIGIHLKAKEFNTLLEDENTIVVDMRNHYESEIGHFTNAITPDVDTFRESLPIIEQQLENHKKDKKILMYCTGGIRCEKASAYFKYKGFEQVYQLEGGIIEYTRQVKQEGLQSKFIGKNFVFDHRLGERITNDIISNCHQCGNPCDNHTNCVNDGCHLLFIQCDSCKEKMENCCSVDCQNTIHLPLDEQVKLRSGIMNGNKIFKKGKSDVLLFRGNSQLQPQSQSQPHSQPQSQSQSQPHSQPQSQPKKTYIGKISHYYTKASVGQFTIENDVLKTGDKILIKGPTTGNQEVILSHFYVNEATVNQAHKNEIVTLKLDFRVRLSDRVYKILG